MVQVRRLGPDDVDFVRETLTEAFTSAEVVVLGRLIDAAALPGFVAEVDGQRAGLLTYEPGEDWQVVGLVATVRGVGVGEALMHLAMHDAREQRIRRLWLVTTNDNTAALSFYQRLGMDLVALHRDSITNARRTLQPSLPRTGARGIEIRHELELQILL
ncbi:MAG: GNAT family N-acetyltransferase [Myxococcales bacterium]|nr:GNAT family N-acetyltransferase [Myxococcales bacterium]